MTQTAGTLPQTYSTTTVDTALIADLALLAALWCLAGIVVNPLGNFPLNDDWSYGRTVEHLLHTGEYRPLGWTSMTLVSNVLWGALFCLPDEFSFTALRLSTLCAGWLGLAGSYVLVRDLQQPRWTALLIASSLALNPIYYSLSNSFMTDVPFTAATIWAAVLLARSLKSGSDLQLLFGTVLAIAATLSRQLAMCVPLAFAIILLLTRGFSPRTLLRAAIPVAACAIALVAYNHWLMASGRVPALYGAQADMILGILTNFKLLLSVSFANVYLALLYLGLFLLPVLVFSATDSSRTPGTKNLWRIGRPAAALTATIMLAMALGAVLGTRSLAQFGYAPVLPMAVPGNVLVPAGLGPHTLRDTFLLNLNHVQALPAGFWIAVTIVGLIGAALLVLKLSAHAVDLVPRLWRRGPLGDNEVAGLFLLLCGFIYLLPFLATGFFDRYVILLIAFFAAGIAGLAGRFGEFSLRNAQSMRLAAIALLGAFGLFAVGATRDYMTWNRVRWQALRDLMHDGQVAAADIDGGFEFNGLYLYDPAYPKDDGRSWWWVHRDTYVIGFGTLPGYKVAKEYTYRHWLPPHVQKLVVSKKE